MSRHVAHVGKMIDAYKIVTGKPGRKRPPGKPKHSWEYNTDMDLKIQDTKVMCSCEHGTEPLGSIKGGECPEQLSDY
jgi:hypothetical protein